MPSPRLWFCMLRFSVCEHWGRIVLATGKNHSLFLISGCQSHHTCGLWMTLCLQSDEGGTKGGLGLREPSPTSYHKAYAIGLSPLPVFLRNMPCQRRLSSLLWSFSWIPPLGALYITPHPKFVQSSLWSEAVLTLPKHEGCISCMKQLADIVKFSLLCLIFTLIKK